MGCIFMFKRFVEIMCANTAALDSCGRNIQMWCIFVILSIIVAFISFIFSFNLSFNEFVMIFIGLETFPFIVCLLGWFWDTLNKYFVMTYPKDSIYWSFEGLAVSFLFIGFAALLSITLMFGVLGSFLAGFILAFGFFYPALFIFLRRKSVFNEDSTIIEGSDEKFYGYQPSCYWLVGVFAGFPMFMFSFNKCLLYLLNRNLFGCVLDLIVAFGLISLMLSPDLVNKILPFELKKRSNALIYLIICPFVSLLVMYFM